MLLLVGVNHTTAPLELRERLAFSPEELPAALERMLEADGFEEGLILSTCNRTEVLLRVSEPEGIAARAIEFLARERSVPSSEIDGHAYRYSGRDAARHLFHVASGLDSLILGEPQVFGQLKQAYASAVQAGSTGPILDHLLQQSFATAKRVRTSTGIGRHAVSVAFAAVELAKKIFGELSGRTVLVVGAGKMAELATRHLTSNGIDRVLVTSRNRDRSAAFAQRFGGEAVPWEGAWSYLADVDVVVSGTAAPSTVLDQGEVREAVRTRKQRPLFIIDIAVPRDVDPEVHDLDSVYLYDIDDLQDVVDSNLDERKRAAAEARRLIDVQVKAFDRWQNTLGVAPTIVALRERMLGVAESELDRYRRKLGPLTSEQMEVVEGLARSVVKKILHRPIRHLKAVAGRSDVKDQAALYGQIFGLAGGEDGPDPVGEQAERRSREEEE
jgi:glutamyl-tRNA reductase